MVDKFSENPLNIWVLLFNITTTFVLYLVLRKRYLGVDRIFLIFSILLFYIYSGFGAAFEKVPLYYSFMYNIFIVVYYYTFSLTQRIKIKMIKKDKLKSFSKLSSFFIFFYFLITFLNAGYPSFNLIKLIKPSAPILEFDLTVSLKSDGFKSILYYILLLIQPFYLMAIYKFRLSPLKLFIAIMLPLYFYFSLGGYVARSYLLPYFAMFIFTVYHFKPELRRKIKIFSLSLVVPIIMFSYFYSEWRLGHETSKISVLDVLSLLFFQESSYPLHFVKLYNQGIDTQILDFFKWLLMLPIPSFIKGSTYSIDINNYFTELITGTNIYSEGYFVLLPGTVVESFLIFGKYLFFLLPFFGGLISGFLYKLFKLSDNFIIMRVYFIFMFMPLVARAGFFSAIPIAINGFIIFYVLIIIMKINFDDK